MPKIICFASMKGGVGKTMITANVAGQLRSVGKQVLLIDADAQSNLSATLSIDAIAQGIKTTADIFEGQVAADELIVCALNSVDIIPSSVFLQATEFRVVAVAGREQIFRNWINRNSKRLSKYDYILIDTNPSMNLINQACFLAADSIVIVNDVSIHALRGSELFIKMWDAIRDNLNKEDNIKALLINNVDKRIKLSRQFHEAITSNDALNKLLLTTAISNAVAMKRTEISGEPIAISEPGSESATQIITLYTELKTRGIL